MIYQIELKNIERENENKIALNREVVSYGLRFFPTKR